MEWTKCEDKLPMIGMPVLAIPFDCGHQIVPSIVSRLNTDYGWAWNNFNNEFPVYADNQAYFTHWMPLPKEPES